MLVSHNCHCTQHLRAELVQNLHVQPPAAAAPMNLAAIAAHFAPMRHAVCSVLPPFSVQCVFRSACSNCIMHKPAVSKAPYCKRPRRMRDTCLAEWHRCSAVTCIPDGEGCVASTSCCSTNCDPALLQCQRALHHMPAAICDHAALAMCLC